MKYGSHVSGMVKAGGLLAMAFAACQARAAAGPDEVAIILERSACYGSCPAYRLTIHGDGRVYFTTGTKPVDAVDAVHRQFARSSGVLVQGTHEDRVSPEAVGALVKQFEAVDFWHLSDKYRSHVTDMPTNIVTLVVGDRKKTVIDYDGVEAGMPPAVQGLEDAIDRIAGVNRWVTGSLGLVPWLEQTGFDFHSTYATELAMGGKPWMPMRPPFLR